MKFRKKPVVIEAVQWKEDVDEIMHLFRHDSRMITIETDGTLKINTLEGIMTAQINDWIIKGVNGEYYPCKPDIFEKTYEKVE